MAKARTTRKRARRKAEGVVEADESPEAMDAAAAGRPLRRSELPPLIEEDDYVDPEQFVDTGRRWG